MNTDVIAVNVSGRLLRFSRIKLKADPAFQIFQEGFRGPSVAQEQELQTRALTMFAQHIRVAEQLGNSTDHRQNLIPPNKCVEALPQVRLRGESPSHAQRETDFRFSADDSSIRRQANIIDLWIRAPHFASGD